MTEFVTKDELLAEINTVDPKEKYPAFAGKKYPIEYIDSRDFERLLYFLFQHEIAAGEHKGVYDAVVLMKGTGERGRDSILQYHGKNVGAIQCKRYTSLVTAPDMAREIIKFCLHAIQDEELVDTSQDFTYFFTALTGLNDPALTLYSEFNTKIIIDPKLQSWTEEVLENNKSLKFKNFAVVETELKQLLSVIKLKLLTGADIDKKLKNAKDVVKVFFEVEKVVDRDLLWEFGAQFMGFKSNEDLEKLRKRLQDIPKESILKLGIFTLYGYDVTFYKKLIANRKILFQIVDIKGEISKMFIDHLKESIEKYVFIYISSEPKISPFTKQLGVPYLFNKFALRHNIQESGEFMHKISEHKGLITELQTIEQHKAHFLEQGRKVLSEDYSGWVGDDEMMELKKGIARFVHAEFSTVDEMSQRFDADMVIVQPLLDKIEAEIERIMPSNGTLIIENNSSIKTVEDFVEILEANKKFNN